MLNMLIWFCALKLIVNSNFLTLVEAWMVLFTFVELPLYVQWILMVFLLGKYYQYKVAAIRQLCVSNGKYSYLAYRTLIIESFLWNSTAPTVIRGHYMAKYVL